MQRSSSAKIESALGDAPSGFSLLANLTIMMSKLATTSSQFAVYMDEGFNPRLKIVKNV